MIGLQVVTRGLHPGDTMNAYKDIDINKVFDEVFNQTDRASAIVSCSLLDELLERTIRGHLLDSDSVRHHLFSGPAPLSTMSAKTNMAYHLGLISKAIFEDLIIIRRVRNEFAHSFEPVNFESECIQHRCKLLQYLQNTKPPKELIDSITNTKTYFQINTTMIASDISARIGKMDRCRTYEEWSKLP